MPFRVHHSRARFAARALLRTATTLAVLLCGAGVQAAVLTVGSGSGCSHPTVQAAINQAQSTPGPDTIRIVRQAWTAQQININTDQDIDLIGGFANCAASAPDGTHTTLDGAGGDARPVLTVRGNGVTRLRNLTLTGGDQDGDDNGGGIYFEGGGLLDIADSNIDHNVAYDGGGIYAVGTNLQAELLLGANVVVGFNTARKSGGGVVAKSIEMSLTGPGSTIWFNTAQGNGGGGNGGGLVVVSDTFKSYAYISSNGIGDVGAIYGNTAVNGGGVAVLASEESSEDAVLKVFSADGAAPVRINSNVASNVGGGIYARPDADISAGDAFASVFLRHVAIDDNAAPDGAAMYIDQDSQPSPTQPDQGSYVHFNDGAVGLPDAAPCPVGKPCGSISGNSTGNIGGAIVRLRNSELFNMSRVAMTDNAGGRLIYMTDERPLARIDNSLLADNAVAQELVRLAGQESASQLTMSNVTITANAIGAGSVIAAEERFDFDRSLVAQPGKTTLAPGGGARNIEYVYTNDTSNMTGSFFLANPRFIDPARGDYHLRAGSRAVDFAPNLGPSRDLDGRLHTIDMPLGGIAGRSNDVGAYERPALQPLVLNSNFDVDLNLWDFVAPSSVWDGTQNASGAAGSGSQKVSLAIDDVVLSARVFCVHLPGPGTYRLNGWGRVTAGSPFDNTARLGWELRYNGGAGGCTDGAANAQGVHVLSRDTTWRKPTTPASIDVSPAQWTNNSSIAIYTTVVNGNPVKRGAKGGAPIGWFDGITLEIDVTDMFSDGFE